MKKMCPNSYHHNDFVQTHALRHLVCELPQSHCGDNREGKLFSLLHIYHAHVRL